MKRSSEEDMSSDVLEKGILAHILRRCSDDSGNNPEIREIVGVISTIVRREHFQDPVLGRVFAAVKLWSSDAVLPLAAELYEMFRYIGDQEAAEALVDLSCSPYPDNCEVVSVGLAIRDRALHLEEIRIEADARGLWIDEECARDDTPGQPDDDVEW